MLNKLRNQYPFVKLYNRKMMDCIPMAVDSNGRVYGIARLGVTTGEPVEVLVRATNWKGDFSVRATIGKNGTLVAHVALINDDILLISYLNGDVDRYVVSSNTKTNVFSFTIGYASTWSITSKGDLVFAGEYGPKSLPDNSRRVYKSTDAGQTWELAFETDNSNQAHIHKVLLDPYTDVLWVSQGDGSVNQKIFKVEPPYTTPVVDATGYQPTDGVATENYILWGKDSGTRGVLRYNKFTGEYDIPLDLSGTPYAAYIFSMAKDSLGNVYAGTYPYNLNGNIAEKTSLWKGLPPDYSAWELIGEYPTHRGSIRHIVTATASDVLYYQRKQDISTRLFGARLQS